MVPCSDARVQELMERHPNFRTFMSRFCDTHGEALDPALIIQHEEVPKGFLITYEPHVPGSTPAREPDSGH